MICFRNMSPWRNFRPWKKIRSIVSSDILCRSCSNFFRKLCKRISFESATHFTSFVFLYFFCFFCYFSLSIRPLHHLKEWWLNKSSNIFSANPKSNQIQSRTTFSRIASTSDCLVSLFSFVVICTIIFPIILDQISLQENKLYSKPDN